MKVSRLKLIAQIFVYIGSFGATRCRHFLHLVQKVAKVSLTSPVVGSNFVRLLVGRQRLSIIASRVVGIARLNQGGNLGDIGDRGRTVVGFCR